jgi:hypothetical protein
MGTNAIPPLVLWISYERSPSDKFPRALDVPHWRWHTLNPDELADSAPFGFGLLGVVARPAIPELTRLARTSSDHTRAERCAWSLALMGPETIPNLSSLATNGPPWVRYAGAVGLERFSRTPEGLQTLPVLIKCLEDTNTYYSAAGEAALSLLALLEMYPASALPALTNALHSPSAEARRNAIGCLSLLGLENRTNMPPSAVPALRAAVDDSDPQVRSAATSILHDIGELEIPSANPQGGANGRQPFGSETNRTPAAAASRRSP